MKQLTNEQLIKKAESVIKPKKMRDSTFGTVGCALLTAKGNLFLGVCIDTWSGMGFCAEQNAIGAMITAREYKIKRIVAVWKDEKGKAHIVSPCGRCSELMARINEENLETEVILDKSKIIKLKDLIPYYNWTK